MHWAITANNWPDGQQLESNSSNIFHTAFVQKNKNIEIYVDFSCKRHSKMFFHGSTKLSRSVFLALPFC